MRTLVYFLLIANAAFLLWNWDSLSAAFTGEDRRGSQGTETLVLLGDEEELIAPPAGEVKPPVSRATGFISSILGSLSELWRELMEVVNDRPQQLPGAAPAPRETPPQPSGPAPADSPAAPTRPEQPAAPAQPAPSRPPPPPRPPFAANCYRLSGYADSQEALRDKAVLRSYGIDTGIFAGKVTSPFTYRVYARIRTDLDQAQQLSEILTSNAIRNTVKEDGAFFLLQTGVYTGKTRADQINAKMRQLGFSTYIRRVGGGKVYNIYYLLIPQEEAADWEEISTIVRPQLRSKLDITAQPNC